jgi:hypothetical protein
MDRQRMAAEESVLRKQADIMELNSNVLMAMRDEAMTDVVRCAITYGITEDEALALSKCSFSELKTATEKLGSTSMFRPRVPIHELLSGDEGLIYSAIVESVRV